MTDDQFAAPPQRIEFAGIECCRVAAALGVIVFHLWMALGFERDLLWVVRMRDWSLPFFTMTMTFFLTRGLMARPERRWTEFAAKRVLRLGLPFLVWAIAIAVFAQTFPRLGWLRKSVLGALAGGSHLWFLMFLLLVAMFLFPGLRSLARRKWLGGAVAVACLCLAVGWLVWVQDLLFPLARELPPLFRAFPVRSIRYFSAVPVGIAFGIWAVPLREFFSRRWASLGMLGLVGLALTANVFAGPSWRYTQAILGITVFLLMMGSYPARVPSVLRPLVRQSYAIYILHMIPIAFARYFILREEWTIDAPLLVGASVAVFAVSLGLSAGLMAVPGLRWVLPTVPVRGHG